ncbi:MAG TPA: hypothetical protein VEA36_00550 [Candidatus Paceibacterota bacterium]|nr:hypothetical protein [Candidatus Paceibacterota bacterium]
MLEERDHILIPNLDDSRVDRIHNLEDDGVGEESLRQARALAEERGITCEPSGIAGLALLLQKQDEIPRDKKILIVNTGKLVL